MIVSASFVPAPLVSAVHVVVDAQLVVGFVVVGVYLSSERREDGAPLQARPSLHVGTALAAHFLITPLLPGAVSLAGVAIPSAFLLQGGDALRDRRGLALHRVDGSTLAAARIVRFRSLRQAKAAPAGRHATFPNLT